MWLLKGISLTMIQIYNINLIDYNWCIYLYHCNIRLYALKQTLYKVSQVGGLRQHVCSEQRLYAEEMLYQSSLIAETQNEKLILCTKSMRHFQGHVFNKMPFTWCHSLSAHAHYTKGHVENDASDPRSLILWSMQIHADPLLCCFAKSSLRHILCHLSILDSDSQVCCVCVCCVLNFRCWISHCHSVWRIRNSGTPGKIEYRTTPKTLKIWKMKSSQNFPFHLGMDFPGGFLLRLGFRWWKTVDKLRQNQTVPTWPTYL